MMIRNWRDVAPSIVHDFGIDYKLLKGQADFSPEQEQCCMEGMLYEKNYYFDDINRQYTF